MKLTQDASQLIAIKGLQYLAGDEQQLSRFLALSGCQPADLRINAQSPEFLGGVLEFFLGHEPTLLAFCAQHSVEPEAIAAAHQSLTHLGQGEQLNSQDENGAQLGDFDR